MAREYAPVAVAMCFGLVLSIGVLVMMQGQVNSMARYEFGEEAKTCIGALERQLDAHIDLVRWLGATLRSTPAFDRTQFQALVRALQETKRTAVNLYWVPRVPASERNAAETSVRDADRACSGFFEFDSVGGTAPAGDRPVYYPISFAPRGDVNLGFDFASDPVLLRYLDLAAEKGKMFFVSEATSLGHLSAERAVIALCPVYVSAVPHSLSEDSTRALMGFAVGVIQLERLTEEAVSTLIRPEVDLHIFDMFGPSGGQFLHFRPGASQPLTSPYISESEIRLMPTVNYIGAIMLGTTRRWLIACTPAPDYTFGVRAWSPLLGLSIGLAFTFVVAFHFYGNIRQRRAAEDTVVRRTAELKRTNEHLVHEVAERRRFESERDDLLALLEASNTSLQQVNSRLERSNRDLQDFALVASHDLKEPLRKVRVLAQSLRDKWNGHLDDGAGEYLDLMEGALQRMHNLITNLLRVSRVSTHGQPFERVELGNLITEVVSDLAVRIEETGGQIDVGPIPAIEADPMQMRQFFQNILDNSLKYHREGIPPRIKVEARTPSENGDTGTCTIVFEDNGTGFAPESTERAFTLFQRLDNGARVEGSGVGLAVCRKIAERHGGTIDVRSVAGKGSTFTITLPLKHNGHRELARGIRE